VSFGVVPNEKLPHSFNPSAGFIATANHKMIPEDYVFKVGYEWAEPYRFARIVEVLEHARASGHKLTAQDMKALQNDVVSLPARALKELLARAAGEHAIPAERLLLEWDCAVTEDSAAAALYEFWVAELRSVITERVLRASARDAGDFRLIQEALRHLRISQVLGHLSQPKAAVFGANAGAERDRILRETLRTAAEKLSKQAGPDPSKWKWGQWHVAWFLHPLDLTPGAKTLMDLGPVPRPGDGDTVNATYSGASFTQVAGASYREIFDLGDWDNSVGINVPGQSGQPGSAHYSDLLPLRAEGRYFPLLFSKEAVERETTARLELKP
jgi:penicillin amidase